MRVIRVWSILLLALGWTALACAEGFSAKGFPSEGKSLADFIPGGWSVEEQASGDLDGDGVPDIAAILLQVKADDGRSESDDELQRAVIVLLGRDGKFVLAGTNDRLVQCKGCGGIKEGVGIGIRKGVVVIDQMSGSREFTNSTWRFRYDPQTRRFLGIGRDLETGDSMQGTGTTESFNCVTGLKVTEVYRYDKKGERRIATSTKKEKVPAETPFLEDVVPE